MQVSPPSSSLARERLLTPRFLVMCAFSFTVFMSLFQLLPTAPYHVIALGGSTSVAGLFLGVLTYASALAAPLTGNIGDRYGQRHVLMVVSLLLAMLFAVYAFIPSYPWLLVLVFVHGVIWSALLTSSGAYMTGSIPPSRRAEGLGYWGLASIFAIAAAPPIGFWVFQHGWRVLCLEGVLLNLVLATIAWLLPDDPVRREPTREAASAPRATLGTRLRSLLEVRALVLSITVGLISFSYGGITSFSAMFAESIDAHPRTIVLTMAAITIVVVRVSIGRHLDRIGHRRTLLPALAVAAAGLLLVPFARGTLSLALAAIVFGAGFGLVFPAFTAYLLSHIPATRRGAAYGAMIAAFDTGIGTGSWSMGWLIQRVGFRTAFGIAAVLASLALPYFLMVDRRNRV
jgi:MFS family permease